MRDTFTTRVHSVIDQRITEALAPHIALLEQFSRVLRDRANQAQATVRQTRTLKDNGEAAAPGVEKVRAPRKPRVPREPKSKVVAAPPEVKAVPPIIRRKAALATPGESPPPPSETPAPLGRFEAMLQEAQQRMATRAG